MTTKTSYLHIRTQYLGQLNLCSQARITHRWLQNYVSLTFFEVRTLVCISTPIAYRSGSPFRRTGNENMLDGTGTPKRQFWEGPCRRPGNPERVMVPCSLLSLSLAWNLWGPGWTREKGPRYLWLSQPCHSLSSLPQSLSHIFRLALWRDAPPGDRLSFSTAQW